MSYIGVLLHTNGFRRTRSTNLLFYSLSYFWGTLAARTVCLVLFGEQQRICQNRRHENATRTLFYVYE